MYLPLSMLKVFLIGATNMNQTIKTAAFTFSGLLLISLISLGWKAYEQVRREAELRQFCDNLAQYTFSVNQRGDEAAILSLIYTLIFKSSTASAWFSQTSLVVNPCSRDHFLV